MALVQNFYRGCRGPLGGRQALLGHATQPPIAGWCGGGPIRLSWGRYFDFLNGPLAAKDAELLLDFNGGGERGISTVVEMSKPKYGDGATGVAADWMSCSNEAIRNEKCTPDAISLRSGGVYGKFRFLGRLAVDPPTSERKCVGSGFLVSKRLFGTTHPSVFNLCAQLTVV